MIKFFLLLASLASAQQRTEVVNPSPAEPLFITAVSTDGGDSGLATRAEQEALRARINLLAISTEAVNVISASNTFSGSLGASASFIGVGENIQQFQELTLNTAGSPSVATGTIYFEFSPDGINWDVSIPFALSGPNAFVPLPIRAILPYYRIRYENGGTPLTSLRVTTMLHRTGAKHLTRFLNQAILDTEPVENVRAFIGGRRPNGAFDNVALTSSSALEVTIVDRPSEVKNRIFVSSALANFSVTTASTTIYEVPAGKTLYVESYGLSLINSSGGANGDVRVRSGANIRIPVLVPEATTGGTSPLLSQSPFLPEPLRFNGTMNIIAPSGTISASFWFIGYLE
jgi:hypothetical protein